MRTLFLALIAPALLSAAPPGKVVKPAKSAPTAFAIPTAEEIEKTICRDRIHEARAANGRPLLPRKTTRAEEGLLIAAVDQRIEGCSVMVIHNDTSDIRPLPKPAEKVGLIPAD